MDRHKLDMVTCGRNVQKVQKAICSGFFRNAAKRDPQEGYRTLVDSQSVYIHPSSALFQHQPEWVVYHELGMSLLGALLTGGQKFCLFPNPPLPSSYYLGTRK